MATGEAQDAPLVSVIMPCFNAGVMLRPALASVLGQTYPNLEIIFVDNNSTDGSLALARGIAAQHKRRFEVVICPQQGVNHARNLGFGHARCDFIQWMDADDEIAPDKISLQVAAMLADPTIDIAYGDWAEFRLRAGHPPTHLAHILSQVDDQVERTLAGVWYPPHLYLLHRAAAERLQAEKAWWPGRPVGTDVEYSAVAALLGLRFRHVPDARVRYNIWSSGQIGASTTYGRRVAGLEAIYRRLRGLAEARTLTERQQRLLGQDWLRWRLEPAKVRLSRDSSGVFHVSATSGDKALVLQRHEAATVEALLTLPQALATPHVTLRLAQGVPELKGDPIRALDVLDRLRVSGLLTRG